MMPVRISHPRCPLRVPTGVPMLYKTLSAAVYGIDANIIEVEVDVSGVKQKEDHFHTVGLPDAAVRESRDRVRSALKNCGYDIPPTDITINLAPADIRKEGSGFDLPWRWVFWVHMAALTRRKSPTPCSSATFPWTVDCAAYEELCRLRSRRGGPRSNGWLCRRSTLARPPWSATSRSIRSSRCSM